ncbi:MAG TPA: TaqI-like C-terminal specificity domain-containing protein, partial [Sulfuricurvum sp.]|nr:TaqI-like C-terminal specificity domain-containing protein [Sulfuricurvum sp.]
DRNLLKANTVKEIRSRHQQDGFGDRSMYDYYKLYFNAINTGNDKLGIPKYNGGLFATDEMLDSLKINDSYLDMEAQKLSDFDFESDISVNILGHIFEQSLTDLEEMNASINDTEFDKKKSKRKKDGVFYTPEYITRYIVENTLGKLCSDKKTELKIESETVVVNPRKLTKQEQSYKEILLNYREWLTHLKILDPACGSGAFLNQALEFLIREHTLIRDLLLPYEDLMIGYEVEKSILEHNLYGVDINEDAVEIAKLSLWLRTAHKGRELINLGAKIKCGNSLISDRSVAENAFVWEDEFPEVFAQGGFDVVIGNPPYGAQLSEKHKKYFYERFKTVEYQLDTYLLFIEKSIDLLKPDSLIGFIMPNTWMSSLFAKKIRNFITYKVTIPEITHYDYFVFEDATVEADTYFFKTTEPLNNQITIKIKNKISEKSHIVNQEIWQKNGEPINIYETMELQIIKAKMLDSTPLGEITQIVQGTKPFQVNKGVPKQTKEILEKKPFVSEIKNDDTFLPLLRGSLMERYSIHWSNNYWISYGEWLAEPRLSAKFDCDEKLVIRQTSDSLIATYDNQQFIARDNLYVIRNDEKNINLKYLLALINSKLLTWFYRNIINPEEGKALAQVKRGHLQILPIKRSSADDETQFINFVDEILNAKETLKKYKKHFDSLSAIDKIEIKEATEKLEARVVECEKEIDGMVYALYGLSADEIRIVEGKV